MSYKRSPHCERLSRKTFSPRSLPPANPCPAKPSQVFVVKIGGSPTEAEGMDINAYSRPPATGSDLLRELQ